MMKSRASQEKDEVKSKYQELNSSSLKTSQTCTGEMLPPAGDSFSWNLQRLTTKSVFHSIRVCAHVKFNLKFIEQE